MKTNQPAVSSAAPFSPVGINPIRRFLKVLPEKAMILGVKCHCAEEKESIRILCTIDETVIHTFFQWEGGRV